MNPQEQFLFSESARRTFWLIHLIELLGSIFTRRRTTYTKEALIKMRVPFPCDETTFELVLDTSPGLEFLVSTHLKRLTRLYLNQTQLSLSTSLRSNRPSLLSLGTSFGS